MNLWMGGGGGGGGGGGRENGAKWVMDVAL